MTVGAPLAIRGAVGTGRRPRLPFKVADEGSCGSILRYVGQVTRVCQILGACAFPGACQSPRAQQIRIAANPLSEIDPAATFFYRPRRSPGPDEP